MVYTSAPPIYLHGETTDDFIFIYRLNNYSYFESYDGIERNLSAVSFTSASKIWLYHIEVLLSLVQWCHEFKPTCIRQTVLNNRSCSGLITNFNRVVLSTKWRTLRCAQQAWRHPMPLANEHLPNTHDSTSQILHRSPIGHELSTFPRTPHTLLTFSC